MCATASAGPAPAAIGRGTRRRSPEEDYARLVGSIRRYRVIALGPPLVFAAVLVPLSILHGLQYGLLLFVLVFAYAIFVLPKVRERATEDARRSARSWELHPE